MRNNIWAAPCGDAGADTTDEAASKQTLSGHCCAMPCQAADALYETTRPIVDGEGLRKAGREIQIRISVLNRYTALGIPVTEPVG